MDNNNWIVRLLKSAEAFNFIIEVSILQSVGPGHVIYTEELTVVSFSVSYFLFSLLLNRNQINITLKFTSRFLRPAEASLLLISKPKYAIGGTTMTFALKGEVLNFKAVVSRFYLFCVSHSLLGPWNVPSTAVPPSVLSVSLLLFEILGTDTCAHNYICTVLAFCVSDILALILFL